MKTSLKWMLALSTSLAVAMPAYAQSNAEEDSSGLGEIVVTANRRAENMQDVPIAISAVTAETAAKLGVTDLASLTNVVPGFTFNRQGAGSQPFIRGVGNQSTTIGNEPSVAMFVDDLYIPTSNSAMFEFNNIERVEVLKGRKAPCSVAMRRAAWSMSIPRIRPSIVLPTWNSDTAISRRSMPRAL